MTSVPPLQPKLGFYKREARNKQGSRQRGDFKRTAKALLPAKALPPGPAPVHSPGSKYEPGQDTRARLKETRQ